MVKGFHGQSSVDLCSRTQLPKSVSPTQNARSSLLLSRCRARPSSLLNCILFTVSHLSRGPGWGSPGSWGLPPPSPQAGSSSSAALGEGACPSHSQHFRPCLAQEASGHSLWRAAALDVAGTSCIVRTFPSHLAWLTVEKGGKEFPRIFCDTQTCRTSHIFTRVHFCNDVPV